MTKAPLKVSVLLSLFAVTSVCQLFLQPQTAGALSTSDWEAGYIISDEFFTDSSAMSVSQIQYWLDSRLANCDPNGTATSELPGGTDYNGDGRVTRAEYGKTYGNPAPFTCLNDYYEVPKTSPGSSTPASNYGKSSIPDGAKSAAQLIYDAGKAYNISPKVLLVKLGTESAGPLTSDPWPFKSQYTYAMGAHCPDSGPGGSANCDTDYSGFSLQMREAAKLLRWYIDNMDESWWSYKKPYQTNYILWNVQETNCGGSNVLIQNKATAALYTYTPYQPNSASLNSYPGTGNGCSSYGNRNFWFVYGNWFGKPNPNPFRMMETPRWLERNKDTYKYNLLTGETVGSVLPQGTQAAYADWMEIDGMRYRRTQRDKELGLYQGVPVTDVQDISYEDLPEPTKMIMAENHHKVIPDRLVKHWMFGREGQAIKFASKITVDGKTYYRTQTDTENDTNLGIRDLYLINPTYKPMVYPRKRIITRDVYKVDPKTDQVSGALLHKGDVVDLNSKMYIDGTWYYRTVADTTADTSLAIPRDALGDIKFEAITPEYIEITNDAAKYDISRGIDSDETVTAGERFRIEGEADVDGLTYYRIMEDRDAGKTVGVLSTNLTILPRVTFEYFPVRTMTITEDTSRIHSYYFTQTGEAIKAGETKKFTSMTTINGVDYYRTQNDTKMNWNRLIPADKLQ